ncbi:MAG: Tat (twin-arginine translocation) pathway signal sequence containing protein [Gemmatimonadota bacterium]|nr:Tat (twin-arginine translocation) pathway signal sequence containing protein [Gemmatimonadota bacterium]
MTAAATALAAGAVLPARATAEAFAAPNSDSPFDETWTDRLTGKHKQVFDANAHNNGAFLGQIRNFFNTYRDVYGFADKDISVVSQLHGTAIALAFNDATWTKYKLGEFFKVDDPQTKTPALKNPFVVVTEGDAAAKESTVSVLQGRGVSFLVCNNTLLKRSALLAKARGEDAMAIHEDLKKGLLPGIYLVPAAMVALNRAQEHGCSYAFVGG